MSATKKPTAEDLGGQAVLENALIAIEGVAAVLSVIGAVSSD